MALLSGDSTLFANVAPMKKRAAYNDRVNIADLPANAKRMRKQQVHSSTGSTIAEASESVGRLALVRVCSKRPAANIA